MDECVTSVAVPEVASQASITPLPVFMQPNDEHVEENHGEWKRWREEAQLSVVMIAKNGASQLLDILPRIAGEVHETIFMDTGSTIEISAPGAPPMRADLVAQEFGCKVYHTNWQFDFSLARNEAMSKATGKWILSLDSDEVLTRAYCRKLNYILAHADPEKESLWIEVEMVNEEPHNPQRVEGDMNVQIRCFPNHYGRGLRWRYAVHEQIGEGLEELGITRKRASGVRLRHIGYRDPMLVALKCQRNREILARELAMDPPPRPRWITRFHAAKCAFITEHHQEALEHIQAVAEDEDAMRRNPGQCAAAYRFWADIYTAQGKIDQAIELLQGCEPQFPHDLLIPALIGLHLRAIGKKYEALAYLEKAAKMTPYVMAQAAPTTQMLYKIGMALAGIYAEMSREARLPTEGQEYARQAQEWAVRARSLEGATSELVEATPEEVAAG